MKKTAVFAFIIFIAILISSLPGTGKSEGYTYAALTLPSSSSTPVFLPLETTNTRDFKIPDEKPNTLVAQAILVSSSGTPAALPSSIPVPVPQTAAVLSGIQPAIPALKPSRLVVIDAGHGGNDPGTTGFNGLQEKNVTLDIALRLNQLLKNSNFETYMIRTTDVFMEHKSRIFLANEKNAALYLSIHCDWFKDSSFSGASALYMPSETLSTGNLNELAYAQIVQEEFVKALGIQNRGIKDRADLAVLRHAKMPSVLLETSFLSNQGDSVVMSHESNRQKAAEGLANAVRRAMETAFGK